MKLYKIIIFVVLSAMTVFAQGAGSFGISDSRSSAMGGGNAVSARGIYSFGTNPANLAIPTDHSVDLSLVIPIPNINAFTRNDFLSWQDYNYYFSGVPGQNGDVIARDLTNEDKTNFKSLFAKGSDFNTFVSANLLALSVSLGEGGAFGFAITDVGGVNLTIPKDLVDLAVDGNEIGRVYNIDDFKLKASYLREYSFSYARELGDIFGNNFLHLTGGLSLKIVSGLGYLQTQASSSNIETLTDNSIRLQSDVVADIAVSPDYGINWSFDSSTDNRSSNISPFPQSAGSGFGVSFGLAAQIDSVWSVGFALTDLGSVTWDKETVQYASFGSFLVTSVTDSAQRQNFSDSLKFKGSYSTGFSTSLPGALRVGVSMKMDNLLLVLGYNQGFNDEPFNTTKPRVSIGAEWKPFEILPLRSGFSFGGVEGFKWSFGFGLDFGLLEMNFASTNFGTMLSGNSGKGLDVSLGSRWKF